MIRPVIELLARFQDEVTAPLRNMEKGIAGIGNDIQEKFTGSLKSMATGMAEFFAAEKLLEFFGDVRDAGERLRTSQAELRTAITDAGASMLEYGDKAEEAVAGVAKLSLYTETDLRNALARLITDTGDVSASLANVGTVADVAASRHMELQGATDLVAKAMEGNATALKRQGIAVDENLPLLDQLISKTRGAAEAALESASAWTKMKKWMEEARESISKVFFDDFAWQKNDFMQYKAFIKMGLDEQAADFKAEKRKEWQVAQEDKVTKVAYSKETWDGILGEAQAGGAAIIGSDAKLKEKLVEAQNKLAALRKSSEVESGNDMVTVGADAAERIKSAEAAVGEARKNLDDAVAKRKEENGRKSAAAAQKVADEEEKLLESQRKIAEEFLKDFGTMMPESIRKTQAQIEKLGDDNRKMEKDRQTASGQYLKDINAAIDANNKRMDAYKALIPVLQTVSDIAEITKEIESDPNPYTRLVSLNAQLAYSVGLRKTLVDGSQEQKALDATISQLNKDIKDTKEKTLVPATGIAVQEKESADHSKGAELSAEAILQKKEATLAIEAEVARQAISIATSSGLIDGSMGRVLDSAVGIGMALAHGDMVGAIAGFGGVLASLFGESPENAARKALIAKNNERLADLTAINGKLVLQGDTGAQISGFQAFGASDPIAYGSALGGFVNAEDSHGNVNIAKLSGILRGHGLTVAEMRNVAQELGIDLGEKDGTFSGAGVQQFIEGLGKLGPTATAFDDTFGGTVGRVTLGNTIQGGSGLSLADWKRIAAESGSPVLWSIFDGLGTAGGAFSDSDIAEIHRRVEGLGQHINEQTYASLGGLTTGDFTSALGTIGGLTVPVTASGGAPPSTGTTYTPPSTGASTYTPTGSSVSYDLTPVVDAITQGFDRANGFLELIEQHTGATADAIAGGGLGAIAGLGIQRDADTTSVNAGASG